MRRLLTATPSCHHAGLHCDDREFACRLPGEHKAPIGRNRPQYQPRECPKCRCVPFHYPARSFLQVYSLEPDKIVIVLADSKRQRVLSCPDDELDDEELLALLQESQLESKAASEALQENTGGSCSTLAAEAVCKAPPTPAEQPDGRQEQQQQGHTSHTLPAEPVADASHLDSGKSLPGSMQMRLSLNMTVTCQRKSCLTGGSSAVLVYHRLLPC